MSHLILYLVLVIGLVACSQDSSLKIQSTKQDKEACASLAKFAERAMQYHQSNTLMSKVFKEVDSMVEVPDESKVLLKNIVMDAYKQPVFTDQSFRDRQVVDFTNDTHLKCLEIME